MKLILTLLLIIGTSQIAQSQSTDYLNTITSSISSSFNSGWEWTKYAAFSSVSSAGNGYSWVTSQFSGSTDDIQNAAGSVENVMSETATSVGDEVSDVTNSAGNTISDAMQNTGNVIDEITN